MQFLDEACAATDHHKKARVSKLRHNADLLSDAFHGLATHNAPDGRYAVLAIETSLALRRISERLKTAPMDHAFSVEVERDIGDLQRAFFDNDPEMPIPVIDPKEVFAADRELAD
jgi:hypothetical protein